MAESQPAAAHAGQSCDNLNDRGDLLQRNALPGRLAGVRTNRLASPVGPILLAAPFGSMFPHLTISLRSQGSSGGSQCQAFPAFWVWDRHSLCSHHRHRFGSIVDGPASTLPLPSYPRILRPCRRLHACSATATASASGRRSNPSTARGINCRLSLFRSLSHPHLVISSSSSSSSFLSPAPIPLRPPLSISQCPGSHQTQFCFCLLESHFRPFSPPVRPTFFDRLVLRRFMHPSLS